ncbi:DUF1963 domain-containing protein [Roseomonas sp. HJA6]|uniref:DUF1963 domain-containing protein n=1 Tax=Roseomonas alba TaxID=2846776 RepID=A0ABS7AIT7_9PROT|nr:DUF1963 domain-containing protein [Neoroseomonas alba]MBW6401225.1 DUF1963 domain-containing protein [Neoroseomonas alba]
MSRVDEAHFRHLVEETRLDAYLLTRRYPPGEAGTGVTSYFGATPRLPHGMDWPVATDRRPLNFLAQIDLAALAPMAGGSPLPAEGTLFFFADACLDRGNRPLDPAWAAVRYTPGGTASETMRPAPDGLPPLFDRSGFEGFPWLRERDPMGSDEPSTYPFWPIAPRLMRTYDETTPASIRRDGSQEFAYERAWKAAQEEAFAEAIGEPARFQDPSYWSEPNRARFDFAPIRPQESRTLWLPDDAWPYAWVHIRIFTAEMMRRLEDTERNLASLLRHGGATEAAVAEARAVYARAGSQAEGWYARARTSDLTAPVPPADRAAFVAWLRQIEQPYKPEWSLRDPNARRFRLLVDGNVHVLDAVHLNRWTAVALLHGTHACLGYGAPGTVPRALPPHLLGVLRPAYAASQRDTDGRRRLKQHQLLGVPVTVQTAAGELRPTHRLLAQFESDDIQFFFFGGGMLQFWITPADLAERCFDRCVVTAEST